MGFFVCFKVMEHGPVVLYFFHLQRIANDPLSSFEKDSENGAF